MQKQTIILGSICVAAVVCPGGPALGGSHLWVINEIFSNADGTIQFIEMKECCGADDEINLFGKWVLSEATQSQLFFPENLPPDSTANKHLLLATPCFAALPGAPTPDYIIDENFLDLVEDKLTYFIYSAATLEFGPPDLPTLPTDGIHSLHRDGKTPVNSPTNFDDETGSVEAPCNAADLDFSGAVGIADLLALLAAWGTDPGDCPPDLNGDGTVGIGDLMRLLANWGPCA